MDLYMLANKKMAPEKAQAKQPMSMAAFMMASGLQIKSMEMDSSNMLMKQNILENGKKT